MSSEMAKIADDLDSFVHDMREDGNDASALWLEQRASALRRIAAAGEQKPVAWQTVPVDPTREMQRAGLHALDEMGRGDCNCCQTDVWAAMIEAAPQPAPGWDDSIITQSDLKAALEKSLRNPPSGAESALTNQPLAVADDTTIPDSSDMDARFEWLESKAIDMGYVLAPAPEHPDSPHKPLALDSNASAEARLRDALAPFVKHYEPWMERLSDEDQMHVFSRHTMGDLRRARKALSAYPDTSDCDKQGSMGDISPGDPKDLQELLARPSVWKNDTTKSEGGGQVAPAKCSATGVHPTDTSCAAEPEVAPGPSDLHASDCEKQGWLAKDVEAATKRVADWKDSDRPADVTVEQAARKCADDLVLIVEAATRQAHRTGNTFVIDRARVASMIAGHFNAFTVGRR